MSEYWNSPFMAFAAAFSKGRMPLRLARKRIYPPIESTADGRARYAPYGLRKVEASLLENGFREEEVAVVHPLRLNAFVGPATKAIGISTMDPTGKGSVSNTYSSLLGSGEPMNAIEFRALVNHSSIRKHKPKVIVGGFGAWQLEQMEVAESYGVDCVIIGEGEETVKEIVKKAINGEPLPRVMRVEKRAENAQGPMIRHAAIHGCVQISKGCGRNCQFCTPSMQKKYDVPLERILREVEVNTREGANKVTLVTEDLLMYGAGDHSFVPNKAGVINLLRNLAKCSGLKAILPSNFSLAPVVCNPGLVQEAAEILLEHHWYSYRDKPIVTSETGIETGSTRLMRRYMAGKMLPFEPEQWIEIVNQALGILNDNYWYPALTFIIGLPDEREDDLVETLELVDDLEEYRAFYVPLLFTPLPVSESRGAEIDALTKMRFELMTLCWKYNMRIWGDSFASKRIQHPDLYKIVQRLLSSIEKLRGSG